MQRHYLTNKTNPLFACGTVVFLLKAAFSSSNASRSFGSSASVLEVHQYNCTVSKVKPSLFEWTVYHMHTCRWSRGTALVFKKLSIKNGMTVHPLDNLSVLW